MSNKNVITILTFVFVTALLMVFYIQSGGNILYFTPNPKEGHPMIADVLAYANLNITPRNSQNLQKFSNNLIFEDLNCVNTLPSNFYDASGNMPIIIPLSLRIPKPLLECLYHRYVSTLQTLCVYPKLMGMADNRGGYVCVDNDMIPEGRCNAFIFGIAVDNLYTDQLKAQYKCSIGNLTDENKSLDGTHLSSNLFRTLKSWITSHREDDLQVHLLVLTVTDNPNDIYVLNELLQSTSLISRIHQITLKMFYKPEIASSRGYQQRLIIFRKLYTLGFRIFFYNQEFSCAPPLIEVSKFLSCYSVYLMRPSTSPPERMYIPDKETINRMNREEKIRVTDRYLSALQILCKQVLRLGNIKSGGWNVCHDVKYRPKSPCLVYSFGINTDWSFDEEVAAVYGCEVYSFDPSLHRTEHIHSEQVYFYNLGISGKDEDKKGQWKLRTLTSVKKMLGHSDRILDILKLDVEYAEWATLPAMYESGVLRNVRQFYIEFHCDEEGPKTSMIQSIKTLYDIGFQIFWTHKNLACKRPLDGGFATGCYEVYFLNTKL